MRDISSIVGLKVISSKEGRDVGTVSQVIVDLHFGRVEGIIVGTGPSEKGIDAADIQVIGADAVMVETYRVAKHLSEVPRLMEKRLDPSRPPREVLTDTGKRVGLLSTIYIDPANKKVTRYEVSAGAWRDITEGVLSLAPMEGTVDGRDSVVVPTAAFIGLGETDGGLKAQLSKLASIARTQAKQAADSLDEGAKGIKRGAVAVKDKATEAASKIRESGKDEEETQAAPAAPEPAAEQACGQAPEPEQACEEAPVAPEPEQQEQQQPVSEPEPSHHEWPEEPRQDGEEKPSTPST